MSAPGAGAAAGGGINNPQNTPMLKAVNKYLLQAKKVDKVEPVIAYYCRMFVIQSIMKLPKKSKEELKLVADLMGWLETNQAIVKGLSKEDARARCEAFALQVFEHADNEDRSGNITKQTALTFHSAYIFMDICKQFGELATDLQQKHKYAVWKTTDITKALKEGRTPKSGGVGEDEDGLGGGGGGDGGGFIDDEKHHAASSSSYAAAAALPPSQYPPPSDYIPHEPTPAFQPTPTSQSQSASTPAYQPPPTQTTAFQPPPTYTPAFQPAPTQTPAFQPAPTQTPAFQPPPSQTPAFQPSPSSAPAPQSHPSTAATRPTSAATSHNHTSAQSASGLSLPAGGVSQVVPGGWMIRPAKSEDRTRGMLEGERLVKHALNDLRMDDVNHAAVKLQQALAYLLPYVTKQPA